MNLKRNLWAALMLPALAFTACNDDANDGYSYNPLEVRFSSVVEGNSAATRAAGTAWSTNDLVGVYMIKAGTVLSAENIVNGAANRKYVTTSGDGNFQAYNSDEAIYYPEDGTKVDFISCYPYKSGLAGYNVPIDVTNQSDQTSLDLLYSNSGKNLGMNSTASLTYTHKLTRVVMNIKSVDGNENLSGLAVKFSGFKTKGNFSLVNGTVTLVEDSKQDVSAKVSPVAGGGAMAEVIMVPETAVSGATIEFELPSAGKFTQKLPENQPMGSGTQINFDVELDHTGGDNKVVVLGSTITKWTEVDGGKITVDFDNNGGGTTPEPDPEPTPDPDPTPGGTGVTIFSETFGATPTTLTQAASYVGAYPDYDNKAPISFSNSYSEGKANIRTTKTINDNHLWLPSANDNSLLVSGINTVGCTNLVLTYDILPNLYAATGKADVADIQVKWNGTPLSVPGHEMSKANGDGAVFYTVTISTGLTANATNTLEFYGSATANTLGFRIDNIKIVGDK